LHRAGNGAAFPSVHCDAKVGADEYVEIGEIQFGVRIFIYRFEDDEYVLRSLVRFDALAAASAVFNVQRMQIVACGELV
jgi:hypothetical protein